MALRNKPLILGQFLLYSVVSFLIIFFIGIGIRDILFSEFVATVENSNPVQIINSLLLYTLIYVIFDVILLFTFTVILNTIYAKILNIEVGKIALFSFIALIGGYLLFHTVMYLWFYIGDPLKFQEYSFYEYFNELLLYYPPDQMSDPDEFTKIIPDLFVKVFYDEYFRKNPTPFNYFILYLLLKGFVSDVPFEIAGLPFNFFKYEVWFVFIIYLIIFIPLFIRYINGCECVTEEEIGEIRTQKKEKYFGKQFEEGVVGEFTVSNKKNKSKRVKKEIDEV